MTEAPAFQSTLIAAVRYRDADAAIAWLQRALGFTTHAVYRDPATNRVAHAELALTTAVGTGMLMLGEVHASADADLSPWYREPAQAGGVTSVFYLVVPDCTPAYARAQDAGAEVLQPLKTMDYGGAAFSVRDPEGFVWSVGEYNPWARS